MNENVVKNKSLRQNSQRAQSQRKRQSGRASRKKVGQKKGSAQLVQKNQSGRPRQGSKKFAQKKNTQLIISREQLMEEARKFNLLSDVFIAVVLKDIPACQHVLRIITQIPGLKVKEIRTQYRISKIISHDAILDILAEDEEGRLYNIEIQRASTIDHARRTRFYGSMIDSEFLQKGKEYDELPKVRIIYISESDIWKEQKTVYKVSKSLNPTGQSYDDGMQITYVNAEIDDGSEIAKLMKYFKTADPHDMSQGALSKRVHFLKCEEGGYKAMCEVAEKIGRMYEQNGMIKGEIKGKRIGEKNGIIKGKRIGEIAGKRETAFNLVRMGMPEEKIAEAVAMKVEVVRGWLKSEKTLSTKA